MRTMPGAMTSAPLQMWGTAPMFTTIFGSRRKASSKSRVGRMVLFKMAMSGLLFTKKILAVCVWAVSIWVLVPKNCLMSKLSFCENSSSSCVASLSLRKCLRLVSDMVVGLLWLQQPLNYIVITYKRQDVKKPVRKALSMSEMTTQILEESLGKTVLVRLKGGKSLRGRLKGYDQHLNLVLEETEDTTSAENVKKLGVIIVRGDNVILISPPPRQSA
jgi:small nuclear ribonucleoprotein